MEEEMWPEQPKLKSTPDAQLEEKPIREIVSFVAERQYDEFDDLLLRKTYWSTIRITGWILRFVYNLRAVKNRAKKRRGPLTTDEVTEAQNCWIRRTVTKPFNNARDSLELQPSQVAVVEWHV